MIDFRHLPGTNIVELHIDGPVTRADYDRVEDAMEEVFEHHETVRVVEVLRNLGSIEPRALWADLKWTPRHLSRFSHAAVVADQNWVAWMTSVLDIFVPVKVRLFSHAQVEEARRWIRTAE